jgi:hypothetical protein
MATMPPQKPGRSKQSYMTPACFIEPVKRYLNITEFDIDLAAEPETAQAPTYLTKEDDAFSFPSWNFGSGWKWLYPKDCALLLYSRDALACIDNGDWPYNIWTWRY